MLLLGWCASPKGKHKLAEIVAQKRFAIRPVIATNFTSNFPIINFQEVKQVEKISSEIFLSLFVEVYSPNRFLKISSIVSILCFYLNV